MYIMYMCVCIAMRLINHNEEHVYTYVYIYTSKKFIYFFVIYIYLQKYSTVRICELQSNPLKLGHTDQSSPLVGPHTLTLHGRMMLIPHE